MLFWVMLDVSIHCRGHCLKGFWGMESAWRDLGVGVRISITRGVPFCSVDGRNPEPPWV